jgi:hypothetical protein
LIQKRVDRHKKPTDRHAMVRKVENSSSFEVLQFDRFLSPMSLDEPSLLNFGFLVELMHSFSI